LQQSDHRLIGYVGAKCSGRYPCKATSPTYTKSLVFEDLFS